MNNNHQFGRSRREVTSIDYNQNTKYTKRSFLKKMIILATILAITLTVSTLLLKPLVPVEYLIYSQIAQIAIVGYVVIEIIGNTAFNLAVAAQQSLQTAKSIKSLMRIVGSVVIIVIAATYLSQNAVLAASIATISGIVVGFAGQTLIGNMIAGMYLTTTRPFKIGDMITVFGNTGRVVDIGLLYCVILMENGDTVRAPSSALITTSIILREGKESDVYSYSYIY
ncbi:MAG: mechanosensitive ion channel family protein [Nitrososphaeraceae archaeon]|nr:mechanosensitive ion channel family protein [Nitrososphaeraceae archaeon]